MLTFYFAPNSTASLTAAVLAELGTPHDRIEVAIGSGTRSAAFRAINPNGRVPVIVHDGEAIWEAAAITIHLGETFGVAAGLWPAPGPLRGRAQAWLVWSSVNLAEAGGRLAAALPAGSDGGVQLESVDAITVDPTAEARARADLAALLGILDAALAGRDWLLDGYGLVDTHISGLVGWLTFMDVDLAAVPNVAAWLARAGARPALQDAA